MSTSTQSGWSRAIDSIEETLIALLLGVMTLITFANVIARYVFNSNILWALEATVFLFAWLVLLGASYAVKALHSYRSRYCRAGAVSKSAQSPDDDCHTGLCGFCSAIAQR